MKQAIQNILTSVPPYVLFLAGFGSVVAFGLFKLYAVVKGLQA